MQILETGRNIFDLPGNGDAVCITTNGIVKKDGKAVMGKGIALEANNLFHIDERLGSYLTKYGNRAFNLGARRRGRDVFYLISFPTKFHWRDKSDIQLIKKSAGEVVEICDMLNIQYCYIPPVGCGCGGLQWSEVEGLLRDILSNRFIAVLRKQTVIF